MIAKEDKGKAKAKEPENEPAEETGEKGKEKKIEVSREKGKEKEMVVEDDEGNDTKTPGSRLRKKACRWTCEQVGDWLQDNYLGDLRDVFFEHAVDGNRLVFLTKENLREMGIESPQMADLIIKKLSELRFEQNIATPYMYPTDSIKRRKKSSRKKWSGTTVGSDLIDSNRTLALPTGSKVKRNNNNKTSLITSNRNVAAKKSGASDVFPGVSMYDKHTAPAEDMLITQDGDETSADEGFLASSNHGVPSLILKKGKGKKKKKKTRKQKKPKKVAKDSDGSKEEEEEGEDSSREDELSSAKKKNRLFKAFSKIATIRKRKKTVRQKRQSDRRHASILTESQKGQKTRKPKKEPKNSTDDKAEGSKKDGGGPEELLNRPLTPHISSLDLKDIRRDSDDEDEDEQGKKEGKGKEKVEPPSTRRNKDHLPYCRKGEKCDNLDPKHWTQYLHAPRSARKEERMQRKQMEKEKAKAEGKDKPKTLSRLSFSTLMQDGMSTLSPRRRGAKKNEEPSGVPSSSGIGPSSKGISKEASTSMRVIEVQKSNENLAPLTNNEASAASGKVTQLVMKLEREESNRQLEKETSRRNSIRIARGTSSSRLSGVSSSDDERAGAKFRNKIDADELKRKLVEAQLPPSIMNPTPFSVPPGLTFTELTLEFNTLNNEKQQILRIYHPPPLLPTSLPIHNYYRIPRETPTPNH